MKFYGGKVFTRKKEYNFTYPEDMEIIMNYLNNIGEVHVEPDVIEDLYYDFCGENDVGWLDPDGYWLERFAEWLEKIER